jgi:uncharacterized membrane protein
MGATSNPSAGHVAIGRPPRLSPLMKAILVFSIIGLLDAAYLTYVHYYGLGALACLGGHHGHSSCATVQSSVWSKVDGVPVALLGLIGYVSLLASLRVRGDLGRATGFLITLIGFGFSAYLTYREAHSIHAYCEWCLGSAVCMTILVVLTGARFLRGETSTS